MQKKSGLLPKKREIPTKPYPVIEFPSFAFIIILFLTGVYMISLIKPRAITQIGGVLQQLSFNPEDAAAHLQLMKLYGSGKQTTELEQEMALLKLQREDDAVTSQILGAADGIIEKSKNQPQEYFRRREYWLSKTTALPQFRDGWVQLAYLAFNEGNNDEATFYIQKIKSLDPNFIELLPEELRKLNQK